MIRRGFIVGGIAVAAMPAISFAKDPGLKARALIIANGYQTSRPEIALSNTLSDGRLIEGRLRELKFTSVERLEDAGEPALRQRLSTFKSSLGRKDIGLIYIAGHGIQIDDENFLLLGDGQTYMSLISIIRNVRVATDNLIVMLDACRTRPYTKLPEGMRLARAVGKATRSAEVAVELAIPSSDASISAVKPFQITGSGVKIVFATDPQNVAYDAADDRQKNSPFAIAMAARLAERRSLDDVIAMVTGDVIDATEGDQSPWSQGSIVEPIFLAGPPLEKNPAKPPFQVPG